MIDNQTIEYEIGGIELVDFVAPLWEKLNNFHALRASSIKGIFAQYKFEDRKRAFEVEGKKAFIVLVKDSLVEEYIGYAITSVSAQNIGEVESLYVDSRYRGLKIGDVLMKKSLGWLSEKNTEKTIVGVSIGNEDVFDFYSKYGFYPKATILEKV